MAGSIYFSGLASGLDTESIIKQLMDIERIPLTRLQQRKSAYETQKNAWNDINTRISTLQSKLAPLKLASTFSGRTATSSNEATFTATVDTSASIGSYRITVNKLARAEIVQSTLKGSILADTFLGAANIDLGQTTAYINYDQGKVTLGGAPPYSSPQVIVSNNVTGLTVSTLRFYANASKPTGTDIKYYYSTDDGVTWTQIADPGSSGTEINLGGATQIRFKAELSTTDPNVTPELLDYRFVEARSVSGTFKINGREINIATPTSDLTVIRDAINNAKAGVTASIINDKLQLTSNNTGLAGAMKLEDVSPSNVLTTLGLLSGGVNNDLQAAQDAEVLVNGALVKSATNTITNAIPGVTLNLLKATGIEETLTIAQDTKVAVDALQAFVDQYNSVMDFISTKIGKDGDLQGDPTMARLQQTLWTTVTGSVNGASGKYRNLWDIGISTGALVGSGSLTFDRSGKLTLDTAKLTAALEADPASVQSLFSNDLAGGVAQRLDSYIYSLIRSGDGILNAKEQSLQNIMDDIDDQIARMEDSLTMKEDQLRRQFTAMEQALAALQSQGNWLAGQIAGLGAYQQK
ncbi:hypothetical protein MTAT_10020 [Moorella thermoacetica]|uniref:Flagellar hook-associated protein 2 n=1 Tax=Neomoorella thermoacetica TaxID=1525 RepID=A0AAC9HG97_NEOTH|nr:flagellar filament capping protein FliD [Moorella thermoacetica]AOQ23421.1 Flagellar hook-associated protein 2 [Moorella thermoacetica]TYL13606.1 hypothetical protein MTAT_10020 [Moorella thermoacetica]